VTTGKVKEDAAENQSPSTPPKSLTPPLPDGEENAQNTQAADELF